MTTILTANGDQLPVLDPAGHGFDLSTIAQGLAHVSLHAGQTQGYYCEAQRAVLLSRIVAEHNSRDALLHNPAAAFGFTLPPELAGLYPTYREHRRSLNAAIRTHYGLTPAPSAEITAALATVIETERRDLLPRWNADARTNGPTMRATIVPLPAHEAGSLWLARWANSNRAGWFGVLRKVVG